MKGRLVFVSSGVGVAKHLTLAARDIISQADHLAYDDLIHPSVLQYVKASCQLEALGYRSGPRNKPHPYMSENIRRSLLAGRLVVRLKGGDINLFSRIYQEWQEVQDCCHDISFVPGLSAGMVAAAEDGVPLTSKGVSRSVSIETAVGTYTSQQATRLVYMPRANISRYCRRLKAKGYAANTPATFVCNAGSPLAKSIRGTIQSLPFMIDKVEMAQPGVVILGDCIGLKMKGRL